MVAHVNGIADGKIRKIARDKLPVDKRDGADQRVDVSLVLRHRVLKSTK